MADSTLDTTLSEQARAAIDIVTGALQDAVRKEIDALRTSIQGHLVALDRVLSPEQTQPTFEPIVEQLCSTIMQRTALIRADFEMQLAEAQAATAEAASARTACERLAAEARHEANVSAHDLEQANARIEALERREADVILQRDIAEAHLEGEAHNRTALTAELESARAQVQQAKAEVTACRLELRRSADRIRVLEHRLAPADGDPAGESGDANGALEQVRAAMQTLNKASTRQHLLAAGVDLMAAFFSRVALCAAGPQGLTVWRSRGFDRPLHAKTTIPLTGGSPVARALESGDMVTARAEAGALPGLSGSPAGYAIALPLVANEGVTMVMYAENPPERSNRDTEVAEKIAGIVSDHLAYRLRRKATAAETTQLA